jgi:oligopeptide/dipeptide ABC transporter ATP-binding protein
VVAETVDDVAVMYAGRVVETGTVEEVLLHPRMPYTRGLLESIPSQMKRGQRLAAIKGTVPNPFSMPSGCKFEPRCPYAWDTCSASEPELVKIGDERTVRCWLNDPANKERLDAYLKTLTIGAG